MVTGPLQFPTEGAIWWAQLGRAPPELTARRDAKVVPMKKALIEIFA
jgi:hypothetical protein